MYIYIYRQDTNYTTTISKNTNVHTINYDNDLVECIRMMRAFLLTSIYILL